MGSRAIGKLNTSWFPQESTRPHACSRNAALSIDWTMTLLGSWLLSGVLMDGWAHNHFGHEIDTFFTPWHAVLYSGYFAVAVFHAVTAWRFHRKGCAWLESMPAGYGLSLIGVFIFALSGIGDLIWHLAFGIEVSVSAGFSPPHLGIMVGIGLIVSGPLRSAWSRPGAPRKWLHWLPALLSLHMTLTLMSFVTQYAHPLVVTFASQPSAADNQDQALGAVSILFQTALLMGWILYALRRWKLPPGSLTFVLTLNGVSMCLMRDTFFLIPAAALAGACGDILLWRLSPSPARPIAFHVFGFAVPVIYFAFYFGAIFVARDITWPMPLWTGATLMSGIVSLLISYLILPPQPHDDEAAVREQL